MMIADNSGIKGSHIRSLSAPTIQVRKNRTSNLRKIFSVHNEDLSYLTRPPKGETNPTVAGQNKSAATLTQKQIGLWFRERCYTVDKMEKYEDEIYTRLVSITKTKWKINRAQSTELSRSASRFSQGGAFPRIDSRNNGMVARSREGSYQMKSGSGETAKKEGEGEAKAENVEAKETEQTEAKEPAMVKIVETLVENNKEESNNVDETKPTEALGTSKTVTMANTSAKPSTIRPATQQQQNPVEARPTMSPRAATSGEEMLESARKAINTTSTSKPDPAYPALPQPKTQGGFAFSKSLNKNSAEGVNRSESQGSLDRKSIESVSKAKEIEMKILNEPFTYWKKDNVGKLIRSDMPYKRREFPLPIERHDDERRKKMLDKERRAKREQMKRYRSLCDDLDALEKWNPLDDIRFMEDFEKEQEKKAEFDAQEKWRKLGMLRHWVKAFKMQEEKDLANLDPNSEEALRYCKYLRLKERRKDLALMPQAEKEARKSSWMSMHKQNKPNARVY